MTLIFFNVFSLNTFLNTLTTVPKEKNHTTEAREEPIIKYFDISAGKEALKLPKSKVPSINA